MFGTMRRKIGKLSALRILDLEKNGIEKLPDSIEELKKIRIFSLRFNQIVSLPESIGKSTSPIHLDLYTNRQETQPKTILKLKNLKIQK